MNTQFNAVQFATTLKVWRKFNLLSLSEVESLTSISTATLSRIETMDRTPTMAEFSHLCELMQFLASDFFQDPRKVKNG